MNQPFPAFFALAAMAGSGLLAMTARDHLKSERIDKAGLNAHESHASGSLLGQFRTNTSSWLWLRADLYLHNGVQMRMLSKQELAAGRKGVGSSDKDSLHDDSIIVSVVPMPEDDFRGWMGDVERATKAWKDMRGHGHNDPKDALPLFRLMTWVDPSFTPGWVTGATIMARGRNDASFEQAIAFLHEGLKHNPKSVPLLAELGRFWLSKKHDFDKGLPYLTRAVELPVPTPVDEIIEEDYLPAYRWAALGYRETGQPERQRAVALKGLHYFPDDPVLMRLVADPPVIFSPRAQDAWLQRQIGVSELDDLGESNDHDHDH